MKKIYVFKSIFFCLFLFSGLVSFSQEMILGGNMEDEEFWLISALNQDAENSVEYIFGYTENVPSGGSDGCLYVTGTNTGSSGGNLTNHMFYQQVTLQRGEPYTFNLLYKDVRTNNYWFEAYIGGNEPALGSDYGKNQGAIFLGGFKSINWESNCPTDEFDGSFLENACIADPNNPAVNPVSFEGEGDTIVYVGFRMGIYDGDGNGYTFEVYVDNVSLMGDEISNIPSFTNSGNMKVYPNPATCQITISGIRSGKVQFFNAIGQKVHQADIAQSRKTIDVSGLDKGLYLLKSEDSTAKLLIE